MVYYQKRSNRKMALLFIVLSVLVVAGVLRFIFRESPPYPVSVVSQFVQVPTISPTPMPFVEMTIPYLRDKNFESVLSERREVYRRSTHTAYTTSYTSDGIRINGLLTIPLGDKPDNGWPAVVFVHGYIPPAQYKTTENYAAYIDALARNGFVVFKIDLRGHGNSEGEAGGGYYSADYVIDTLHAVAALEASDFVNPEAIGLWGHSMAGNVTLRAMTAKPDIKALVIWAGAVYSYLDQQQFGINDNSFQPNRNPSVISRRRRLTETVGSPSATSTFWRQVAPTNFLSDLKGAIQLHHAIDDNVVNIGYSRGLMEKLDETQVPHELFEYRTGGHNISGSSFTQAMQRTVGFYKKYLN